MADIKTQLPVKLTDNTYTASITSNNALKVDMTWGTVPVTGTMTAVPSGTQTVTGTVTLSSQTVTVASGTVVNNGGSVNAYAYDSAGNAIATSTAAPGSTDRGFVVRNIPSGTQTVTGTVAIPHLAAANDTVTATGTVTVVPSGTQTITGTVVTSVVGNGFAEDSAHVSGDAGSFILAVRQDTKSNTFTDADGDYSPVAVNSNGHVRVSLDDVTVTVPVTGTVTLSSQTVTVASGTVVNNGGSVNAYAFDGSGNAIASSASSPAGTERGLIVRNIPSGTQTVTGTVTSTGTVAVTGTVTATPTGTQAVSGTVSAVYVTPATASVVTYYATTTLTDGQTGTLTYTTAGSGTFFLKGVLASSSGAPCRVDVLSGTVSLMTAFYSAAVPALQLTFNEPAQIGASTAVNVKVRNDAGATQDVFVTVMGYQG